MNNSESAKLLESLSFLKEPLNDKTVDITNDNLRTILALIIEHLELKSKEPIEWPRHY